MGSEWRDVRFEDAVELQSGFAFKSKDFLDEGELRLARGANISQGSFNWSNTKYLPSGHRDIDDRYRLASGDVLLAMDRPWIPAGLKYARVGSSDLPAMLVQRVARLRGRVGHLDQRFLYYLIGSPAFTGYVRSVETGTTIPHISGKQIQGYRVSTPPVEEQRAIAEVLGALDDRIEWCARLRKSCVELLTTAFAEAALQRVAVGELADVVAGQSPPGSTYNTDGEGLPFFQGSAQFGALVPTAEKWCSAPQRVAEPGDLLFSVRAPVGDLNVATQEVCIGRGLAAIRSPFRAATYAALTLAASAWSVHDGSGTVFGSINGRDLRATQVPWPDDVEALAPMLEALMDRALAADVESRGLAKARDALLPPLLSGKLRIEDPARLLEAVA